MPLRNGDEGPSISIDTKGNSLSRSKVGRNALILVVERNPAVQRLERYLLKQAGYQVEFASDGLSALEMAKQLRPDLLLAEVLVPKLDGLSVCRALKSDPLTRAILVIIFSHLDAAEWAQEVGADAFLPKPLVAERLIDTIRSFIERREKEGESSHEN